MRRALIGAYLLAVLVLAPAGHAQQSAASKVVEYPAGALAPAQYRVIARVPASHWLTAITPRTFADQSTARAALLNEAARRGGDGVVNVTCLRAGGVGSGALLPGHYCFGSVIKLVQ